MNMRDFIARLSGMTIIVSEVLPAYDIYHTSKLMSIAHNRSNDTCGDDERFTNSGVAPCRLRLISGLRL